MSRVIPGVLIAAMLTPVCAVAQGWHVYLPGGQIRFEGMLLAEACNVDIGDRNQYVKMGQVSSNRFTGVGSDADPIPFEIHLTDCNTNVSQRVSITFNGVSDGKNPDILSIGEGTGIATNVGVAIFDVNNRLIPINSAPQPQSWSRLYEGPVTLHYIAKYRATGFEVSGGTANAQAWFSLTYE
ncbi:fimbrial protein [Pantoea ananatis]|uniref:fimbrial protein n=1 Tax=Pantoea ananas TaxID=553 RepID=UPI000F85FA4F|nr:fimbrial protein [Pantoea ananatis]RQN05300.1 type 1 fimbrial protein [Pantoea ananatis]